MFYATGGGPEAESRRPPLKRFVPGSVTLGPPSNCRERDDRLSDAAPPPNSDERHADVNFAINDAFKRARRGLQDQVRRLQGHVKTHEPRAEAAWPTTESGADKTST